MQPDDANSKSKVYQAGDIYQLKYPVEIKTVHGTVIESMSSLTFRRLKGVDLTAIANAAARGHGEALKCIVCLATSITPMVYDQLDATDLTEVGEIAAGFTGGVLPTGGT
jgi:hypothetical protein